MRKLMVLASLALAAAPATALTLSPTEASASARDCRAAAPVGGGVGGALIGGGLSHGSVAGAVLGGVGGAIVGHEVARRNCGQDRRRYAVACRTETHYRDHRPYRVRLCEGRDGVWRPV
jgi:hypothetical protein